MGKEHLGLETGEMIRPEIGFSNIDVSKIKKEDLSTDGMYYEGICIPLKFDEERKNEWVYLWKKLLDRHINRRGNDFLSENQPINLQLHLEDGLDDDIRRSELVAFLKYDNFGVDVEECETEEIELMPKEIESVNLALLQIMNPEEFLLKYTRYQVAASKEIANGKFGFVMDQIDSNDSYKSCWVSQDQKICVIGCIEKVHNPSSKVQLLKIG